MTPAWAAEELVDRYYSDLTDRDIVIEPSCGDGSFLRPLINRGIPVIGVEIDSKLAAMAEADTGARIIIGDFRTVSIDVQPTAVIGNPPYNVALIKAFLARSARILPEGGRAGFILPAYAMQTHSNVVAWGRAWSMTSELLPRRLFPRLRQPIVFVQFRKEQVKTMVGFALYEQAVDIDSMNDTAKLALVRPSSRRMGVWRSLVTECLTMAGGSASLEDLYRMVEPRRPTGNQWWREKVRQTLHMHFTRIESGVWSAQGQEASA